ncbi:hypothetical protein ABIF20_008819 [Bradyrhizobium japonicum]
MMVVFKTGRSPSRSGPTSAIAVDGPLTAIETLTIFDMVHNNYQI